LRLILTAPLLLIFPAPLLAQEPPVPSANDAIESEGEIDRKTIVVVATRIAGQIDTDIPPVMVLDEADITAYGASSIGDLLAAVSPQTGSGRGRGGGRPVILLNGQRISNFRQLRDIPPEAIRRMEVLPEEVALRFGFPPDQRVVNFILKDNFSTVQASGEYNLPTRGGFANRELEAGLVRFNGPGRLSINWTMDDESLLTEAERDIVAEPGEQPALVSDPDPLAFRSLIDDSVSHKLTGTWTTGLGKDGFDGTLTVDGELRRSDARALLGLDSVLLTAPGGATALRTLPGPITRNVRSDVIEGGLTLNKPLGDWRLTATADTVYTDTTTLTDREADVSGLRAAALAGQLALNAPLAVPSDPGRDRASNKLLTVSTFAGVSGNPFELPAGPVSLTIDGGYDRLDNRSRDTQGLGSEAKQTRDIAKAGINLSLPITSRRESFADGLGDFSLNFSGDVNHFSDFGTLTDWSAGVVWSPVDKLTFTASYIVSEVPPSVGQLGNPVIETFNVPVFDFARGETALVTVVSGGNPALLAERQRDIKLSANYEVKLFDRSSVIVEYFRNGSDNVTRGFPLLTPEVEAASPGRVTRDNAGRLLAVDRRPVTFDRVETENLRWGINLSGRLTQEPAAGGPGAGTRQGGPGGPGGAQGSGGPSGPGGPGGAARPGGAGGPGMMPFGMRGPPGGRWNLSIYHTWRFADTVRIGPASATLDQLAGNSLVVGGVPRHAIELEGGAFHDGLGLRVEAEWSAPARVLASGGPGSSDLRFGSVFEIGARLFFDLESVGSITQKVSWLKGVRVAFDFENLLDSRQRVTDGNGEVPFAYQRAFRDPRGRMIEIDLRKTF
jgi:iron complex outermembrane receptor protein